MSKRIARLNEQLKRELSELIRTQVRDPRVGVVTITGVDVAADLGSAKVYVREVGSREDLARTLEGLHAAAPFLRTSLGRSLRVRRIPELRFREDRSYHGARRVEEVLADVLPPDDYEGVSPGADGAEHPGGRPADDVEDGPEADAGDRVADPGDRG